MNVKVRLRLLKIEDNIEVKLEENATVRSLLEKLTLIYGEKLKKLIGDAEKAYLNAGFLIFDRALRD
ncbi:hypothetical protein DRJ04_09420 [Candidatus Aerophobetes bacterium]|uniref:MoaD/ThiS family protein n=1 Tax=Aerophobetes bacterium TaxID=2030807 RepID=A0A662D942_UNCAE|nr:MAG: hypothetical protein DRJ04_09420 [Candidatus Aerophobetes bacterium]